MQHFHIHEQVHKSSIFKYSTKTAPEHQPRKLHVLCRRVNNDMLAHFCTS